MDLQLGVFVQSNLRRIGSICFGIVIILFTGFLLGQEPKKPSSYYIYPAHTQLQNELLPFRTDMVVFLNGTISTKNDPEELDIDSLKLSEIEKKLREKNKNLKNITFYLFCNSTIKSYQAARGKLTQIGKEAGFSDPSVYFINDNEGKTWEQFSENFVKHPLSDEESENRKKDDKVKAFPVRTGLSKWLFHNADMVIILPTISEAESSIPPNMIKSIENLCGDKDLNQDKEVMFRFENYDKEKNKQIGSQLIALSKKMGFKKSKFQQY